MDMSDDYLLALQLQEEFDRESSDGAASRGQDGGHFKPAAASTADQEMSLVDPQWELIDPNPDARALFMEFNYKYFWGKLDGVEVRWSPRMTLCAGVCSYEGCGGLCSVRLSVPLLKLRPRKDLVETLLHEMIHAYLFVTANNRDRDGHGPEFQKHMHRINKATGTNITIYHNFHDEVDSCRQHWWRCNGPCQKKPPYFGMVKRSMNRAPAPTDFWWAEHQRSCGGTYTKVKEPEGYGEKKKKKADANEESDKKTGVDIRKFISNGVLSNSQSKPSTSGFNSFNNTSTTNNSKNKTFYKKKTFTKTKSGGSSTLTNLIDAPALSRKDLVGVKNSNSKVPSLPVSVALSKSAKVSTINDYGPDGAVPEPFNPQLKKVKPSNSQSLSDGNESDNRTTDLPELFSGRGKVLGGGVNDHRQRRIPGLFEPSQGAASCSGRESVQGSFSDSTSKLKEKDTSDWKERKKQALLDIFDSDSDDDFQLIPQPVKQKSVNKSGYSDRKSLEDGKKSCVLRRCGDSSDESDIDDDISLISGKKIHQHNDRLNDIEPSSVRRSGDLKGTTASSPRNLHTPAKQLSKTLKHTDFGSKKRLSSDSSNTDHNTSNKRPRLDDEEGRVQNNQPQEQNRVIDMIQTCPVCGGEFLASYMNTHLDMCLQ